MIGRHGEKIAIFFASLSLALALIPCARASGELVLARAEIPLDGPWKFRIGDDPRWVDPHWDDGRWETVDLTPAPGAHDPDVGLEGYVPGWMERGHADVYGFAWYRQRLRWRLAEGGRLVLIGPAYVEDAYEVYWNGKRVGGVGDFSRDEPRVIATRPTLMRLPAQGRSGEATIAIRVYFSPAMPRGGDAGGIHIAPILAEETAGQARYAAQWTKTFAGYVVDAVEPALMLLLALYAVSIRRFAPRDKFYLPLAAALAATAALRANQAVFFWGSFEDIGQFTIAKYTVLEPLILLLWSCAWNRWSGAPARWIARLACLLAVLAAIGGSLGESGTMLRAAARLAFLLPLGMAAWALVRHGPIRFLAFVSLASIATGLYAEELSAIGVQGIWFPFGVGVSRTQYAYAVLIPALALLCHLRSAPKRNAHTQPNDPAAA
ncbi:glycoside hydrolase family 2 [Luteimonas gilva]|uniref:Glycoside hydrolase family 2 n=1 Tax=Luteimonas gilva TaxID=2572684 RepID=A0A4U5JQC2_9GAMM|nr:glycoside hydrolase family 2 [Luteimonas gilva]TKR31056.1 glycoside hydrolase family 2 [Luteimonas gilva]